jgi:hypothetical protein
VEANSTGGQGSRRAVAPSDDDDEMWKVKQSIKVLKKRINNLYLRIGLEAILL